MFQTIPTSEKCTNTRGSAYITHISQLLRDMRIAVEPEVFYNDYWEMTARLLVINPNS